MWGVRDRGMVLRVIDGDSIEVRLSDGENKVVKLLGVNTPETVHPFKPVECYGPEASKYVEDKLTGKKILLEYGHIKEDGYGRMLAYVYVGRIFINEDLVRKGYARVYRKFPFKWKTRFIDIEEKAQEKNKGLWEKCPQTI